MALEETERQTQPAFPASRNEVMPMEAMKALYARHVLRLCGMNQSLAARLLDVDRGTIRKHAVGTPRPAEPSGSRA